MPQDKAQKTKEDAVAGRAKGEQEEKEEAWEKKKKDNKKKKSQPSPSGPRLVE